MIAQGNKSIEGPLFAFAGGGTGGHLYPAIAVAYAIRKRRPDGRFVFFGTERAIDGQILESVDAELVRQTLPALTGKPWRWPAVVRGFRDSRLLCRLRFSLDPPSVVIGTGGLASVPAVREAHRAGIPVAILNPDAVPGRANRHLASYATVVFSQWRETVRHYPRGVDVRVVGCPVRSHFATATREAGLDRFGLQGDRRMLLVTGASQGARTINDAVVANLPFLELLPGWQVLHLTGKNDYEQTLRAYGGRKIVGAVVAYTEHMAEAVAAADLVVSRAGASTLAELTAVGRPAVLLPYPFHRDRHQWANAECLARVGAARIVRDEGDVAANAPALRAALKEWMTDETARASASDAARRLGRPDAAERIAEQLLELVGARASARSRESVEAMCAPSR